MTLAYQNIDFKNPVFLSFAQWSVILSLKMMYLSVHTAIYRFKNQVWLNLSTNCAIEKHISIRISDLFIQSFANPEDGGSRNVRFNNDEVERVRR